MRIFTISVALCLLSTISNAQYKKASFSSDGGISMEASARFAFISKSKCTQPSVAYSIGRERNDSRYFSWHDFEILLPAKYNYTTTSTNYNSGTEKEDPVTVHAKALYGFNYRFNSGIFLLDNSNEENKLLPFVNFGANFLIHVGSDENSYTYEPDLNGGYVNQNPSSPALYAGLNGGVGLLYKITRVIGIKATAGYALQLNLTAIDVADESGSADYGFYKNHPYVTFGFRFLIPR